MISPAMGSRDAAVTLASGADTVANHRHMELFAPGNPRTARRRVSRLGASAPAEAEAVAAQSLLARVLGRLTGDRPHLLQFLSFSDAPAIDVTRAFCIAAAHGLGRVLQADLLPVAMVAGHDGIVPDATVARLYHFRLGACPIDLGCGGRAALLQAVEAAHENYEMVVFNTRYADAGVEYSRFASAFNGTILLVRAGMTTLSQVRAAVATVQQAGGLVLGVVLVDVPPKPTWLQWLGAL